MNKNYLKSYVKNELNRDPGICILTYPYSFIWNKTAEEKPKSIWERDTSNKHVIIYTHIPFCKKACYFCGFHKFIVKSYINIQSYLKNLYSEIDLSAPLLQNRFPLAINVGGGSPSILKALDLAKLVEKLTKTFNANSSCEISIEFYPDKSATFEKLAMVNDAGANRICLGFQSLNDEIKKKCNRYDTVNQNYNAYKNARDAGFSRISIDLLCGLPNQTLKTWKNSVRKTIELYPEQICVYPLSNRHPGIPLYEKVKQILPTFNTLKTMYFWAREELLSAGFKQVTRHNFIKDPNMGIYEYHQSFGTPCLGLGVNSISFLPGYTYKNVKSLRDYAMRIDKGQFPVDTGFDLEENKEYANSYVIKRLTYLTVDKIEFQNHIGMDFEDIYSEQIKALVDSDLAVNSTTRFSLTEQGIYYTALVKRCFFSMKARQLRAD